MYKKLLVILLCTASLNAAEALHRAIQNQDVLQVKSCLLQNQLQAQQNEAALQIAHEKTKKYPLDRPFYKSPSDIGRIAGGTLLTVAGLQSCVISYVFALRAAKKKNESISWQIAYAAASITSIYIGVRTVWQGLHAQQAKDNALTARAIVDLLEKHTTSNQS